MKKVLYFAFVALAACLCSCNKDEEEQSNNIDDFVRPYYFDWNVIYLDGKYKGDYERLFYNSDSLIFDTRYKINNTEETRLTKFSNHNNVLAGIDTDNMSDADAVELGELFMNEISKENDIEVWIDKLDLVRSYSIREKITSCQDFGLLWGLKYYSVWTNNIRNAYWMSVDFTSNPKSGYYINYNYNSKGGYVRVYKKNEKGSGYADKIATFGAE